MISRACLACGLLLLSVMGGAAQTTNTFPTTGNVGIGTTSPGAMLDVEGDILQNTFSKRQVFSSILSYSNTHDSVLFTFPANTAEAGLVKVTFSIFSTYFGVADTRQTAVVEVAYSHNTLNTVTVTPLGLNLYGNGTLGLNAGYSTGTNTFSLDFTNSGAPSGSYYVEATVEIDSSHPIGMPSATLTTAAAAAGGFTTIPNKFSSGGGNYITSGNVGIGTTSPQSLLSVGSSSQFQVNSSGSVTTPSMTFSGTGGGTQTTPWTGVLCGGDYAEAVDPEGTKDAYEPGDVLVISDGAKGDVKRSSEPYASTVAGVFATKPGVIGRRESLPKDGDDLPMAMVGIVPTKVTAENGPIHRGDLLVTSSKPGYAMKGTDRSRLVGAVIGKAMGTLDSGSGVIEVLVTLQ